VSVRNPWESTAVPGIHTEEQMGRVVFVVSRDHRDLYAYLSERFSTDTAVEVVLDRRVAERRQRDAPHDVDRRRSDRRRRPEVDAELQVRSHAIITLPDVVAEQ
jgi:hypothetical protein